jgi:hypothetical protein
MLPKHERFVAARDPEPNDRIVEFLAIATENRLDKKVQTPVGPTGNLRSVPAFAALEVISSAHNLRRCAEASLPCPAEKLNPEFWTMQRACVSGGMTIGYGPV